MTLIRRGDIFFEVDLTGAKGSVQGGVRPCIVVSNDMCNRFSPVITVVPVTAQTGKAPIPTHLELDSKKYGFKRPSIALAEQVMAVDKDQLKSKHHATMTPEDMFKLGKMLKIQLGLI